VSQTEGQQTGKQKEEKPTDDGFTERFEKLY